jgi:hypothetical protein
MLPSAMTALLWFSETTNAIGLLIFAALLVYFAAQMYIRTGRNRALEEFILQNQLELPIVFHGTLVIEKHKPGSFLQLGKSTTAAGILQFRYRWFEGFGRQAIFDEVVFDGSRSVVELKRKTKSTASNFSQFSAIRMREVSGGRGVSLWHVELLSYKGGTIPFVSSVRGYRQAAFEHTAPIAKAVSAIMALPVHVIVAGNVWTLGWPPKNPV